MWPDRLKPAQYCNLTHGYYDMAACRHGSALFFTVRNCLEVYPLQFHTRGQNSWCYTKVRKENEKIKNRPILPLYEYMKEKYKKRVGEKT